MDRNNGAGGENASRVDEGREGDACDFRSGFEYRCNWMRLGNVVHLWLCGLQSDNVLNCFVFWISDNVPNIFVICFSDNLIVLDVFIIFHSGNISTFLLSDNVLNFFVLRF